MSPARPSGRSRAARRIPPTGEIRQSQLLTTYGPGAMVDLPTHAVLIGGLDSWAGARRRIFEDRLEALVCEKLGLERVTLEEPPIDSGDPGGPVTGIDVFQFPAWFLAQIDRTITVAGRPYQTRPLVPWTKLQRGSYIDEDRRKVPVVPVRFVVACPDGHLDDIDWYAFARNTFQTDHIGQLWLEEGGAGNDFNEIYVRCERTKERRPLSDAAVPGALGRCSGKKPWLGPREWQQCDKLGRLLTRSASMAYFSQTKSVIAIPDHDAELRGAVDRVWEGYLKYCEDMSDVPRERRKDVVAAALEGHDDDAVWAEVQRRKGTAPRPTVGPKQVEIETLLGQPESVGDDRPGGDFYARSREPESTMPERLHRRLDRVVLCHRLREVVAQIGFTRFEAGIEDAEGELSLGVGLAPIAREVTWVPAIENHGEGVLVSFSKAAIEAWLQRPAVRARGRRLTAGFSRWAAGKELTGLVYPGLPYVMLHSLSHLLITQVALECGYSASSIRERIYAGDSGYAILLLTGTTGSEGTLGGLVEVGRTIERHIDDALRLGELCSNDPVCSTHDPASRLEERYLHGAACHGCLLIAETSCERRNDLLDRALVVPTVADRDAAFFSGEPVPVAAAPAETPEDDDLPRSLVTVAERALFRAIRGRGWPEPEIGEEFPDEETTEPLLFAWPDRKLALHVAEAPVTSETYRIETVTEADALGAPAQCVARIEDAFA